MAAVISKAHARCAEDERSESEGRFGEAEPEGGASIRVREVREVFAAEPRPRKLLWRQIADAIIAYSTQAV